MTQEQADALLDAVIECRSTSRKLMMTENGIDALAAENADDAAYARVNALVKEATK